MSRQFGLLLMTLAVVVCLGLVGCPPANKDVIALSNTAYDFALNDTPWTFQVWNADPTLVPSLSFEVRSNQAWLTCYPTSGISTGRTDKKTITATVNRALLAKGQYTGAITVSGRQIVSKSIQVTVTSEGGSTNSGGWTLKNVVPNYGPPYLLEYDFSLRDENSHSVIAEPAQFQVTCMENGRAIGSETDSHLAKGANKQLLTCLVLDYTKSMADKTINGDVDGNGISDAIDEMQKAAKDVFLDSLTPDAQVGIYEFHRSDQDPRKVADFSADKAYLKGRIDAIWTEYVKGFPADTRCWDALYAAAQEFSTDPEDRKDEQRAIIFLSDGRDESSTHTYQDVIDEANKRGIVLYCIGFGAELNLTALQVITSQTRGEYYSAETVHELSARFQQITNDLGGQYILRWATLKRSATPFTPSFTLTLAGHTLPYTPAAPYVPTDYAGDPLQGILRIIPSSGENTTTAFLRAAYVPRYITRIVLHAASAHSFTVEAADAANGGLCDSADWDLTVTADPAPGARQITIQTHDPADIYTAIPYGAFGPILKFEFDTLVQDPATLFTVLQIDNTVYAAGQSFLIDWPPH
jgi:hypothetical protein